VDQYLAWLAAQGRAPAFRRRRPGWHRAAGRLLVACGVLVGLSGLWMTVVYPRGAGTGDLLYALRLGCGSAMVAAIVRGLAAIRRGAAARPRAGMLRGYAIGRGAGTQVLTQGGGAVIAGPPSEFRVAVRMGAGWVINLAVAEWAGRKRPAPPARPAAAVVAPRHEGFRTLLLEALAGGRSGAHPAHGPLLIFTPESCRAGVVRGERRAAGIARRSVRARRPR
jgi:hypothetical protein